MKIKNITTVLLCGLFVLVFSALCFFGPKDTFSESERRALAKFPEITWENISSGKFATEFEDYATDVFPLRDTWRTVKAYARLGLFAQKDNNDLFVKDGHIGKLEYPMKPAMMDYAAELFTKVRDKNFPNATNVYFAMIPDKNKDLADLKLDYADFEKQMNEKLPFAKPIHISDLLTAEDYYYTDTHWRQEQITDVADRLAQAMGTELPQDYEQQKLDVDFYGVYAGQSAMNPKPDTITVLTNETIEGLQVQILDANTGRFKPTPSVYNMDKAEGLDPYELFLSGNQAMVKITNPANPEGKRLIVFRDSFGSSITPLLAQGYSEVILLDLRYVNSAYIGRLTNYQNADILFLYSTLLLNNSTGMK